MEGHSTQFLSRAVAQAGHSKQVVPQAGYNEEGVPQAGYSEEAVANAGFSDQDLQVGKNYPWQMPREPLASYVPLPLFREPGMYVLSIVRQCSPKILPFHTK